MYSLLRPLLFQLDAERSHDLTLWSLRLVQKMKLAGLIGAQAVSDPKELMGLTFPNRVGLSAGLDKNARCVNAWQSLGFGFVEVGTVTPQAQPGNPRPRMFRLKEHEAIINRMGFNNDGLEKLAENVELARANKLSVPLGINIGKNKNTPQDKAVDDYMECLKRVYMLCDYITLNLSSPNTPGLRDLQFGDELDSLLSKFSDCRQEQEARHQQRRPVLVKVAPDMAADDLKSVADKLVTYGIDGVIATNTTIDKRSVAGHRFSNEQGGLSGAVLLEQSTECVRVLANHLQGALAIVGVGGIHHADDAVAKIKAGADLVQLYSGLIYRGPSLISQAAEAIASQCTD